MDFSKTKLYQRTRAGYAKLYSELGTKKRKGRSGNADGGGSISGSGGDQVNARVEEVVSGESSEGLRGSDGRRDEVHTRSRKTKKGHKSRVELGKVSNKGKNGRRVGLFDESDVNDDDDDDALDEPSPENDHDFEIEETSGSRKVQKKLQRGKFVHKGKNSSRNSLIDELEVDISVESHQGVSGSRACLGRKRGLRENSKHQLNIGIRVSSRGCPLGESDDDDGVTYLGDDATCLDEYDPSLGSRVGSNEVKVSPVELDSIQADSDDENSQGLKSPEEIDDDPKASEDNGNDHGDLQPSENPPTPAAASGGKDFEVISLSSSDDGCTVVEVENIGHNAEDFWVEVVSKRPSDQGCEEKDDYRKGKYSLKGKSVDEGQKKKDEVNVMEARVCKKRSGNYNPKGINIEGGSKKKMRADAFCSPQPILDDFWTEVNNDEGGEVTFTQTVEEKGTKKAAKCTGKKLIKHGKEIDVIKILTDTIREEGDGDNVLSKYVTPDDEEEEEVDKNDKEETRVEQILSYKFKFEDEDEDAESEISETEMEVDGLFNEMNMCLQLSEIGSSGTTMGSRSDADFLSEDADQATRCRQGKHYLTLNDEFGIMCRYCPYVEMEIRDILPPLSKNAGRGGHGRHDSDKLDNHNSSNNPWVDCDHEHNHEHDNSNYEKGTVWDLVPNIKQTMYPHQREGFEFIWEKIAGETHIEKLQKHLPTGGSGCIISHAPGTGKSRLTIVFLQSFMRMYPNARPLIIAPRCMLLTWEEEFKKWNVDVPFYILNSNEVSGQEDAFATTLLKQAGKAKSLQCLRLLKLYSWKKKSSVLGITYRLFESLAGEEGKRKQSINNPEDQEIKKMLLQVPTLVVLDEGHTPRNDQSLMWKALLNVKTNRCIILSGTPFQNNFNELYNTLCLVNPMLSYGISNLKSDVFGSKRRGWKNKYSSARGQWDSITNGIQKSPQDKIPELRAMIDPFVHVHKGSILQDSLPGLRDALVVLKPTNAQQALLRKMKGTKVTLENDHLMSLVSVHPYLLPKSSTSNGMFFKALEMFKNDPKAGVKTNFLMELIKLSGALNEKVLVFSQYIKPLEFIMELLKSNFNWVEGRECLYMDGQQEEKHRQVSINTLNDPKSEVKVLLASLRACSEGINLVGASRVVLLDVHWNPSVERQAISRAYRLGQKKLVHVYHLVTGSMEGEKYIRQVEKSHLSELVFSSENKDKSNPKILSSTVSKDKILEEMVQHPNLQHIFEKVIYQPKESDLIHTFGWMN